MCRFIESIRVINGRLPLLREHQHRVEVTLAQHGNHSPFHLKEVLSIPTKAREGLVKCRVIYDLTGVLDVQFHDYAIKPVSTFSIVDVGERSYDFKFEDRNWIHDLVIKSGTDDIIMSRMDRITDSSYANLAFYDGFSWVTPKYPLLPGTRRSSLIKNNILAEADILISDLHAFSHFKRVNAMMTWGESPVFRMDSIQ